MVWRVWRWVAVAFLALAGTAVGGDKTWDNGSGDFLWNTTSGNWTGTTWSNAGDAAVFSGAGAGTVTVPGAIVVRSFNVTGGSYTFSGPGSFTITDAGSGTLAASTVNVAAGPARSR
jgi:hypothetical protein